MTDEEKAKEYVNNVIKGYEEYFTENEIFSMITCYKDGLAEGRKEGYEQGKNNERELQCGRKNYEKDIAELEKENAELKGKLVISEHDREHNDYELSEVYRDKTELVNSVTELKGKITELEKQIEKMKCCVNCKKQLKNIVCVRCKNNSEWELAE